MNVTQQTVDGRPALRVERRLNHSVERVWRAITEPQELARWFVAEAQWTPALGEEFPGGRITGRSGATRRTTWTCWPSCRCR